jgi:hypothetical protein
MLVEVLLLPPVEGEGHPRPNGANEGLIFLIGHLGSPNEEVGDLDLLFAERAAHQARHASFLSLTTLGTQFGQILDLLAREAQANFATRNRDQHAGIAGRRLALLGGPLLLSFRLLRAVLGVSAGLSASAATRASSACQLRSRGESSRRFDILGSGETASAERELGLRGDRGNEATHQACSFSVKLGFGTAS